MAVYNISEEDQKKIAENLKNFMDDEGIKGEIQISFTKDFEVDVAPSAAVQAACWKRDPVTGKWYIKNPC